MAVCAGCGEVYQDGLPACPRCGRAHRAALLGGYASGFSLSCPACGRNDAIQNVPALYARAQANGRGDELSARLAPPSAPDPMPAPVPTPLPARQLILASSAIALAAGGILAMLLTLLGLNTEYTGWLAYGICAAAAVVTFWACSALLEGRSKRRIAAPSPGPLPPSPEAQAQALARWEQLYYCRRDDLIYLPETGECAPAGEMVRFCYAPAEPTGRAAV